MRRLFILLLLSLMPWPALALGSGYVAERAYYRDPQQAFTPDTVTKEDFLPYTGDLRLGYQTGAGWIRLKINTSDTQVADPLILRVGPYLLDRIELHEEVNGQWQTQIRGDSHPQRSDYCPDDAHCFALRPAASKPQTVYLRVKNAGLMFVQTEVMPSRELTPFLVKRAGQITVSLSVALGLLIIGLLYLTINFSSLAIIYCAYQFSVALFVISSVGMLGRLLPNWTPDTINIASSLLFPTRVALTVVLCWAVIAVYPTSRLFKASIIALLVACMINMLLILTGHMRLGLQLNYAVFALSPLVQILGLLSAQKMEKRRRNILLGWQTFFVLAICIGSINAFSGMSLPQHTDMLQHFGDWRLNGGLIGAVFFWAVVSEQTARHQAKMRELEQLRLEAEKARAGEEKLSERGELIDMLTHELKNPLGTIKFALASLKRLAKPDADALLRVQRIDASVDRMDDLIHHVARSNKIELMDRSNQLEFIPAHEVVQDLMGDNDAGQLEISIEEGAAFHTDRQLLWVILENLMSNAVKYAAPSSKISICITRDGASDNRPVTIFQICNQVQAGSEPDETRLFERYYRHSHVKNQPGMGIGLSLVQSAAKKMNSTVSYLAQDGRVTFTLKVPD